MKKTLRWIAGFLLIIAGISLLYYDMVIPGAISLVIGLLILPWLSAKIKLPHLLHKDKDEKSESENDGQDSSMRS